MFAAQQFPTLQVPDAHAYDATEDNELGVKYILLERMPERPAHDTFETFNHM